MPVKHQLLPPLALLLLVASAVFHGQPAPIGHTALAEAPAAADLDLDSLVAVTDDFGAPSSPGGCDGISVLDVAEARPVFSARQISSPGRLAATSDFSTILAISTKSGPSFLYLVRRDPAAERGWIVEPMVQGVPFVRSGGIAVAPDDDTLLVATAEHSDGNPPLEWGPYRVVKYRLSELQPDRVGPERGSIVVPGRAAEILPTADGRIAHIFTVTGQVLSIDIATMREVAPMVQAKPVVHIGTAASQLSATYGHASVSPDGRFLVTNRWHASELNVVDLVDRTATTVRVPFQPTGGVAFSYGPHNTGLLAVHGLNRVSVLEFSPPGALRAIASAGIAPPWVPDGGITGPYASIAWSGDGSYLIAATRHDGADFRLFRVDGAAGKIASRRFWAACPIASGGMANGILTLNRPQLPTPTATATASPSPTRTPPPTATDTPQATLTPTATATTSVPPSPTPTSSPQPAYLPLLLKEPPCDPKRQRADVALVVDASSSMLEPTRQGRTKLAAAVEAVGLFLNEFDLPHDQAALVEFNGGVRLLAPLTGDRRRLADALGRIAVQQQTRIDLGVETAHQEFVSTRRRAGNEPVMIVLTDGRANPVGPEVAVAKAAAAKVDHITIFTIGLGEELDEWALEAMASQPEYYYRAPDGEDLKAIYQAIAVAIPCPMEEFWGRR